MSTSTITSRKIIFFFVFLEVLILTYAWTVENNLTTILQTTSRLSGRLSLFLFSVVFIFNGRKEFLTRWFSNRYYLLFAIVHGIHLIELLIYVRLSGIQLIPYRLAGGFFAYVLIFIMPLLDQRYRDEKIAPRKYAWIESGYLFYVWFIFFMAYLPRVLGKLPNAGGTFAEHVTLFGWVLIALILHLVIRFRKHNVVSA
jgi:hypothetical protein